MPGDTILYEIKVGLNRLRKCASAKADDSLFFKRKFLELVKSRMERRVNIMEKARKNYSELTVSEATKYGRRGKETSCQLRCRENGRSEFGS